MKSFACLAAFVATASAASTLLGHGLHHAVAHPVAVAHAPVVHHAPVVAHAVGGYAQPDLAEPSPYTYTYAVADDYSGAAFNQAESNDGTGVVDGSYSVNLPDGLSSMSNIMPMIMMDMLLMSLMKELLLMPTLLLTQLPMLLLTLLLLLTQLLMLLPTLLL